MNGMCALIAFAGGFVIAQLWKFLTGVVKMRGKWKAKDLLHELTRSGGMPSGHSASMAGVATCLGLGYGFDSGIFALAAATALIIMYDAMHVRYAVGEQGKALNGLLAKEKKAEMPLVEGHTLPQVAAGMILGIMVGVIVFMLCGGMVSNI